MEVSSGNDSPPPPTNSVKALFTFYSNFLQNRLRAFFLPSVIPADSYLSRIANFYGTSRRRRRKTCLPLPLPSAASTTSLDRASTYVSRNNIIGQANKWIWFALSPFLCSCYFGFVFIGVGTRCFRYLMKFYKRTMLSQFCLMEKCNIFCWLSESCWLCHDYLNQHSIFDRQYYLFSDNLPNRKEYFSVYYSTVIRDCKCYSILNVQSYIWGK